MKDSVYHMAIPVTKNAQNIFLEITAFHSYPEQLTTKDSIELRNKNSSHFI